MELLDERYLEFQTRRVHGTAHRFAELGDDDLIPLVDHVGGAAQPDEQRHDQDYGNQPVHWPPPLLIGS